MRKIPALEIFRPPPCCRLSSVLLRRPNGAGRVGRPTGKCSRARRRPLPTRPPPRNPPRGPQPLHGNRLCRRRERVPFQIPERVGGDAATDGGQALRRDLGSLPKGRRAEEAAPGRAHHAEPAAAAGRAVTGARAARGHQLPASAARAGCRTAARRRAIRNCSHLERASPVCRRR